MTATREHLAGLELAYELSQMNSFPVSFERSLEQLIEQAQSAPEPGQGETVEVVAWQYERYISSNTYSALRLSFDQPYSTDRNVEPLMTVAQHNRIMAALSDSQAVPVAIKSHGAWYGLDDLDGLPDGTALYTAAAKPDAELVELLAEVRKRCQLPDWARIRIDAKLAELKS